MSDGRLLQWWWLDLRGLLPLVVGWMLVLDLRWLILVGNLRVWWGKELFSRRDVTARFARA